MTAYIDRHPEVLDRGGLIKPWVLVGRFMNDSMTNKIFVTAHDCLK